MAHFVELTPSLAETVNRQLRRFVAGSPTKEGVTASNVPSIGRSVPVWVIPPELEASECTLDSCARETGRLHHQIGIGPNDVASATSASSGTRHVLESFSEPSNLTERISRAMAVAAQQYPSDKADVRMLVVPALGVTALWVYGPEVSDVAVLRAPGETEAQRATQMPFVAEPDFTESMKAYSRLGGLVE